MTWLLLIPAVLVLAATGFSIYAFVLARKAQRATIARQARLSQFVPSTQRFHPKRAAS